MHLLPSGEMREREQREGNHFKMYLIPTKDPEKKSKLLIAELIYSILHWTTQMATNLKYVEMVNASIQTHLRFFCMWQVVRFISIYWVKQELN